MISILILKIVRTLQSNKAQYKALQLQMVDKFGDTFTLEVPVVIRLTCDCAVADDAVMPIRAGSSS